MGMYIPNMKSEQFYNLCKEHGLQIIAVPVPPHGRLVDADKLTKEMRLFIKENMLSRDDARELLETIEDAPAVIEAEEAGQDA